jgi:GMP synthase (glutamine-hydrolysing)
MPVLGICLGAQLLAVSQGARILRGQAAEYGWTEVAVTHAGNKDALFAHFRGAQRIFQWHSDTFTLPRGAVHLASSASCRYQAIRIGECAYGLQFHMEADRALIRRWLEAPGALRDLQRRGILVDAPQTLRLTQRYLPGAARLARAVFGEFIGRFYNFRRRRAQPSR